MIGLVGKLSYHHHHAKSRSLKQKNRRKKSSDLVSEDNQLTFFVKDVPNNSWEQRFAEVSGRAAKMEIY